MKNKMLKTVTTSLAVLFLLAGCGGSKDTAKKDDKKDTKSF